MDKRSATKVDYGQLNQVSQKISNLLLTTGPLSVQEIQKQTNESYFAVSNAVELLYSDHKIELGHTGNSLLVSLTSFLTGSFRKSLK